MIIRRPTLLALFLSLVTVGCTSVYEGSRIARDGSLTPTAGVPGARHHGIPFMMPKAEYKLVENKTTTPPTYDVAVVYVPDPNQRFTLRLNPSFLAETEFAMDLGPNGELVSVSGKRTDQIVPTGKALVSLALSIIGAKAVLKFPTPAASGGSDDQLVLQETIVAGAPVEPCVTVLAPAEDESTKKYLLNWRPLPSKLATSTNAVLVHHILEEISKVLGSTDASSIIRRLSDFYVGKQEIGSAKPPGDRLDLIDNLHYVDTDERRCVEQLSSYFASFQDGLGTVMQNELEATQLGGQGNSQAFKDRWKKIFQEADAASARKLIFLLRAAQKRFEKQELTAALRTRFEQELGKGNVPNKEQIDTWIITLAGMSLWPSEKEPEENKRSLAPKGTVTAVDIQARALELAKGLRAIADLGTDRWRGRHIAHLQREIERRTLSVLAQDSPGDPTEDSKVMAWHQEVARTAGMLAEYVRARKLRSERIVDVPTKEPDDRVSPLQEYGRLVAEVRRLEEAIETTAQGLVARSKFEKVVKPEKLPASIATVDPSCIAASKNPGWIYLDGLTAPDYVIVLEPDYTAAPAASEPNTAKPEGNPCA